MQNMDRVIVSCSLEARGQWAPLLPDGRRAGRIRVVQLHRLGALKVTNEAGFSTIVVAAKPLGLKARVTKRLMDLFLSGMALLVLSPLMAVVAMAIVLGDGAPALFRQQQHGRRDRFFWIYKFRSMRATHGDADGCRSAARDDDRITRVGRFIRQTSIDELPQLFGAYARRRWACSRTAPACARHRRPARTVLGNRRAILGSACSSRE